MSESSPERCWFCGYNHRGSFFCDQCKKVQPPVSMNPFKTFGLAPAPFLEIDQVSGIYFRLQSQFHPDRFVHADMEEKSYAQSQTQAINAAFTILKNPIKRFSSLIEILGLSVEADERSLLQEVMMWREEIEENVGSNTDALLEKLNREQKKAIEDFSYNFETKNYEALPLLLKRTQYLEKILIDLGCRRNS